MKSLTLMIALFSLVGSAQAHVADMPLLQHALEHGWLALALAPLLVLLPARRGRR